MKKVLDRLTYNFDALNKKISFNLPLVLEKKDILMILNLTDNIVLYNFADDTKGGSYSNGVLTLNYDTTSMSNNDELMVIINENGENTKELLKDIISELKQLNEFQNLIYEKL